MSREPRSGRAGVRSHFGCSTCKYRKLKCDEVKPICGPCSKSSRQCHFPDAAAFRIFDRSSLYDANDEGDTVARQENEILPFNDSQVWIDVPNKRVLYVVYLMTGPLTKIGAAVTFVTLSPPHQSIKNISHSSPERDTDFRVNQESHEYDSEYNGSQGLASLSPTVVSVTERASLHRLDRHPSYQESHQELRRQDHEQDRADECILILRLVRHFKEGPGQWMDAFDTGSYFSCKVPVRAANSPLLKAAVCALSAKHLHRMEERGNSTKNFWPADGSLTSRSGRTDLKFLSAEYYHQAICHLREAIRNYELDPDLPGNAIRQECIFASVAILSMYELMDNPGIAWRAHLCAITLFSCSYVHSNSAEFSPPRAIIHRPVFWSLARQDFLCASITETQTRLDLQDPRLWKSAGLALAGDEHGVRLPLHPSSSTDVYASADVEEDRRSNELTWLLSKIMNHLTMGDSLIPQEYARPTGQRNVIGVTQEELFSRWEELRKELQNWFESLPPSFNPSLRKPFVIQKELSRESDDCFAGFEEIWYELPLCAATMQSYHMARILLLVNQPHESTAIRSTVSARLRSYRMIQEETLRHSREICGISLANPPDPVRVHSVQPLFVAGQAFHSPKERNAVVALLSGIEREVGWSTSYHVTKLKYEWGEGDRLLDDGPR